MTTQTTTQQTQGPLRHRTARPVDPATAPDIHAYVLARLDAHLEELQRLRAELVVCRSSHPGGRRLAAVASATGARRYAADIAQALNACDGPGDPDQAA